MLALDYLMEEGPGWRHALALFLFRVQNPALTRNAVSVMLDHSVMSLADAAETVNVCREFTGRGSYGWYLEEIPKLKSFGETETWKQNNLLAIPTVSILSAIGRLKLYSYREFEWEEFRRNIWTIWNLLMDCKIEKLDSPLERSFFMGGDVFWYSNKETFEGFIEKIIKQTDKEIENIVEFLKNYYNVCFYGKNNIFSLRALCKYAQKKHYPDLFHIWVCCVYGIDYFVTADKKIINYINETLPENERRNLSVYVLGANSLIKEIGIRKPWPLPRNRGQFRFHRNCVLLGNTKKANKGSIEIKPETRP